MLPLHSMHSMPPVVNEPPGSLILQAQKSHFDWHALFMCLYFVNALHLISHILRLLFIYHSLLPQKI